MADTCEESFLESSYSISYISFPHIVTIAVADVIWNSSFRGKNLAKNNFTCANAVAEIYGSKFARRIMGSWLETGIPKLLRVS